MVAADWSLVCWPDQEKNEQRKADIGEESIDPTPSNTDILAPPLASRL